MTTNAADPPSAFDNSTASEGPQRQREGSMPPSYPPPSYPSLPSDLHLMRNSPVKISLASSRHTSYVYSLSGTIPMVENLGLESGFGSRGHKPYSYQYRPHKIILVALTLTSLAVTVVALLLYPFASIELVLSVCLFTIVRSTLLTRTYISSLTTHSYISHPTFGSQLPRTRYVHPWQQNRKLSPPMGVDLKIHIDEMLIFRKRLDNADPWTLLDGIRTLRPNVMG